VLRLDDALGLEHSHRLAQWGAADTKPLGELDLRDARAIGDRAIEDQAAKIFVQRAGRSATISPVWLDRIERNT
jgi:hypothetical protein